MNETLTNVLATIATAVVLPLISYLGSRLAAYLNGKIKDEKARKLLQDASDIVLNAVRAVFQTYVESLKASGGFDLEAQATALGKAKEIALSQLSSEASAYIAENYGDVGSWVTNRIEASINLLKNG